MKLDDIRELIELMKENEIAEIDLEEEGRKVRLVARAPAPPSVIQVAPQPTAPAELPSPPEHPEEEIVTIDSPIVGTFYRSPSPENPAYVEVGDSYDEETVVCIVEAMKVMNEIKPEGKGEILEVLIENGQPVEFGQPLFRIKPAD